MGKPAEKGQGPAAGHARLPLCLRVTGKQDSGSFLGVKETTGTASVENKAAEKTSLPPPVCLLSNHPRLSFGRA